MPASGRDSRPGAPEWESGAPPAGSAPGEGRTPRWRGQGRATRRPATQTCPAVLKLVVRRRVVTAWIPCALSRAAGTWGRDGTWLSCPRQSPSTLGGAVGFDLVTRRLQPFNCLLQIRVAGVRANDLRDLRAGLLGSQEGSDSTPRGPRPRKLVAVSEGRQERVCGLGRQHTSETEAAPACKELEDNATGSRRFPRQNSIGLNTFVSRFRLGTGPGSTWRPG